MKPQIVFQDKSVLIVDKPADLVVNRVSSCKTKTLQDWLESNFRWPIFAFPAGRSGIVHRLDKETSGLLVVAKTREAFENLQGQFKKRRVKKQYLALVHGRVEPTRGQINQPLARSHFNRKKFGVSLGGRPSKTKYQKLSERVNSKKEVFSLLELWPETGRTHQIRVHLKSLGHPIVGDAKYGGRKTVRADRVWCPRQFLHASFLAFTHPESGRSVEFKAPLPSDLKKALETLQA